MLDDFTTDLQVPCDQTTENDAVLRAPGTDADPKSNLLIPP
jgi:hypothetical protein